MDPNETLKRLRALTMNVLGQAENGLDDPDSCFELAECAQALDEWISKGGFLPAAWSREESGLGGK